MNGKQLKNSILQWAIQGKLVPQDPNDEPASVLLERIRAEKKRLIKEGKIKKDKNESIIFRGEDNSHYEKFADGTVKCIDDEIPFEVPQGWAWVRLRMVADVARGASPRPIKDYLTESPQGVNWIKIGDTEKGGKYINSTKGKIKPDGISRSRLIHKGDFLLTNSMSFGRPYISNIEGCIHDGWLVISPATGTYTQDFLFYLLSSRFAYDQFCGKVSGAVVQNLNSDKVANAILPIPPIEEQQRIVFCLESVMPYLEKYGKAQEEQDLLNASIYSKLRKSILQDAIRGKLVAQSTDDVQASILLEQIRQEKQRLLKLGHIKNKDIMDSVIFKGEDNKYYEKAGGKTLDISDEIPFDIPVSWEWIRMGALFSHNTGKALNRADTVGIKKMYLTTSNVYWNRFDFREVREMYFSESELEKCTVQKGDLLVCEGGDVGRTAIWKYDEDICIQNHIHRLRAFYPINTEFYYLVLYHYKNIGNIGGKGIGIQGLSSGALHRLIVPLPPINEQYRITAQYNTVIASTMRK